MAKVIVKVKAKKEGQNKPPLNKVNNFKKKNFTPKSPFQRLEELNKRLETLDTKRKLRGFYYYVETKLKGSKKTGIFELGLKKILEAILLKKEELKLEKVNEIKEV